MLRWRLDRSPRRLTRERRTVAAMIDIYCRGTHDAGPALCAECRALYEYAMRRLDHCPFGAGKPTCANCSVHCYQAQRRAQIRQVMRYAGPRMLWRHPLLALRHVLDGRIRPAALASKSSKLTAETADRCSRK